MDIIENLEWRYAVKKFDKDRMLPQLKVDRLKKGFKLTATSYGLQPIKMIILSNKELQQKLVSSSFNQQQVVQASHVLILCIEKAVDENFINQYFDRIKKVRGTSNEILDPFKKEMVTNFSVKTTTEIQRWATNQAYLAMGNLLTICAAEKIDACPMEGFNPLEYDEILELKNRGLTSVLVMPVGYRAADDMFSELKKVRKSTHESIIEL